MALFDPLTLRDVCLANRVVVSPMSQYVSKNGFADDWHFAHLARFALGGAGLVFTEATAVEARGRRTHGDLGLWHDDQIDGLARITRFLKQQGSVPGIQLAHAGRKASERRPWHGETPVDQDDVALRDEAPWAAIGPSAEPYGEGWPLPQEMTEADIKDVVSGFRDAAARALEAGFAVIEVYAGHGFLMHQFYSPIANRRDDAYGGSFDGRARLSLEVAAAIREVWPENYPLLFRLSVTDWIDGGWDVPDSIELARRLKAEGVDMIDCSSGGIGGAQKPRRLPLGPGFQAPLAEAVKQGADIATMTVGFIWQASLADAIVRDGRADLVAVAREALNDPNWTLHAARELGIDTEYGLWKPQFGWWLNKRARAFKHLGLDE